jgi:hypothetical protein
MVTHETRNVLALIVSFTGPDGLERWMQRLSDLLQRHASGNSLGRQTIGPAQAVES